MTGRDRLLLLADLYCASLGVERTTASWRLFQDTNKLDAIAAGRDLYLGRYERAMQWLSDHWPAGIAWPAEIQRPAPVQVEAA